MSDDSEKPKKKNLSEISHLFLSSVRDLQGQGLPRPQRVPPKRSDMTIDLTPEEFAKVYGNVSPAAPEPQRKSVPVAAVLGAHLNGKQFDWVKKYARHRAGALGRVGLIELDGSELRLMCFDLNVTPGDIEPESSAECAEPRQMSEALEEMNWDVEQWLVLLPNPRAAEAKAILNQIEHWVLLSTSDHDGVVSSYRMIKGLVESVRPRLMLAVLDAADVEGSARVFAKLSGVCEQFLNLGLTAEPPVQPVPNVNEHLVLYYRPARDKAQLAAGAHWTLVEDFLAEGRAIEQAARELAAKPPLAPSAKAGLLDDPEPRQLVADVVVPTARTEQTTAAAQMPAAPAAADPAPVAPALIDTETKPPIPLPAAPARPAPAHRPASPLFAVDHGIDDVIDLPEHDATGQCIVEAVLRKSGGALIECPLRPPMCVEARVAVARDRGLVLLSVATQGLGDLRSISSAYRWLIENRELICMALPQFTIDPRLTPSLRLLVDRADLSADALHPMLQSEHVTIQSYRKLRWGEKLGVSLEAA
jgi:hypothetical protein